MAQRKGERMHGKRSGCDVDALRDRLASLIKRRAPQSVIDAARKKLKRTEDANSERCVSVCNGDDEPRQGTHGV